MTMRRDIQRSRVYAWEDRVVAPRDSTRIAFSEAQGMVNATWSELRLRYPPRIEALPGQAHCRLADADRLTLRLPPSTPSWCLLHELAHAMTTTHEGVSDGHGPVFMGVYVQLLSHYLRLDPFELRSSLAQKAIQIDTECRPTFCDA